MSSHNLGILIFLKFYLPTSTSSPPYLWLICPEKSQYAPRYLIDIICSDCFMQKKIIVTFSHMVLILTTLKIRRNPKNFTPRCARSTFQHLTTDENLPDYHVRRNSHAKKTKDRIKYYFTFQSIFSVFTNIQNVF